MDLLNMHEFKDRRFERLSTGEKQKVSIARCLIHDPSLLILDEPTAGLDVVSAKAIIDFIHRSKERRKTILLSTHYMTEAEMLCDRIGFIHAGRILAMGTQDELYGQTGTGNLMDAFLGMVDRAGAEGAE